MDLEEYSKSKNMRIIKRIIRGDFVLGYKKNGSTNGKDNKSYQPKLDPENPPEDNNIKDKPQPPIGDKPCVKPKQDVT
ncbi:MAG: hypothetical protein K0R14_2158 [Burkholderiales bacterium]|jgi:hypothetical protein|nr:hypothetical protein [Burkholderiales bacterium]